MYKYVCMYIYTPHLQRDEIEIRKIYTEWAKSLIKIKEMKLRFAKYILCFQQNQLTQIQKTFLGFQLVSYVACYLP